MGILDKKFLLKFFFSPITVKKILIGNIDKRNYNSKHRVKQANPDHRKVINLTEVIN